MRQDFLRFTSKHDAGQPAATMGGHADKIRSSFLGHGENPLVDLVPFDKYRFQRDTRTLGEPLDSAEDLFGLRLVVPTMRISHDVFCGSERAIRAATECWIDMQRNHRRARGARQQQRFLNGFLRQL